MRMHKLTAGALAISMACAPAIGARAAEGETANPNAATEAQTAAFNAQASLVTAQKALVDAQITALGLPKHEGRTTLSEGAGAMEANLLSASAVDAAAREIARQVRSAESGRGRVLLLSESDPLGLGLPTMMSSHMELLLGDLATAMDDGCPADGTEAMGLDGGATLPLVGAVLGLFKTDTKVTGLAVTERDETLISAVASQQGADWIVPGDLLTLDSLKDSQVGQSWIALARKRQAGVACRNRMTPGDDSAKARIADIDAAVAATDAFAKAVFTVSDTGLTPFGSAIRAEMLRRGDPRILRLKIEKAGGTMLQQENLWTFFGASGVRITGGLVVTYRLSDPTTGQVLKSGMLVCRTALKSLKAIQAGEAGDGVCRPTAEAVR
jgi:hypothetical protein